MTPDQIDAIRTFARGLPSDGTAPDTAILQLAWDYEDMQSQLAAAKERADAVVKALEDARGQEPVVECFSESAKAWRECARPESCTNVKRDHYAAPVPAQPAVVPEWQLRTPADQRMVDLVRHLATYPATRADELMAADMRKMCRDAVSIYDAAILSTTDTEVKR